MSEPGLDALICTNIGDLDAAARYLNYVLQPAIGKKIDDALDAFKRDNGWDGESGFDDADPWLAPRDWRKAADSADDEFISYFAMAYAGGSAEVEAEFWLSTLVGVGTGAFGFRWVKNDVKTSAWRKVVNQQADIVTAIRSAGFEHEETKGTFFLPVRIDKTALAEALNGECPEQALAPLQNALAILLSAKADFDALLKATAPND